MRVLSFSLVSLVAVSALLNACGSDTEDKSPSPSSTVNATNSVVDLGVEEDMASPVDMHVVDMGSDMAQGSGCLDILAEGGAITIDAEGPSGQFFSDAVFAGDAIWVVYNRPESESVSQEAIFVARIACDGSVLDGPTQLSVPESGRRNYEPTIEAYGGTVHIAWVSQPVDANPKLIQWVGYRDDGTRINPSPSDITPSSAVDPVSETIWELDIAAYDGGGVVVASALGADTRVVAQRFDAAGARVGEAFFPYEDKGVDQKRPTVAADSDGTLYIGWVRFVPEDLEENIPETADRVFVVKVPVGASMADAAPAPAEPLMAENSTLRFSGNTSAAPHWLAFQSVADGASNIIVRDGADLSSTQRGVAGTPGWVNFRPNVAGGATGGTVVYMRYNRSPVRNDIVAQPFAAAEIGYDVGDPIVLVSDTSAIPPNGPGITHLGDDVYFVTWSSGASASEARVRGRIVRAAMP